MGLQGPSSQSSLLQAWSSPPVPCTSLPGAGLWGLLLLPFTSGALKLPLALPGSSQVTLTRMEAPQLSLSWAAVASPQQGPRLSWVFGVNARVWWGGSAWRCLFVWT